MATNDGFEPAWWIPGPHGQTLWGKFVRRRSTAAIRRERIETPDGDFLDLHHVDAPAGRPRLVFLHGLEGTVRSHYAIGLFEEARIRGWGATLMVFRGCGAEPNRRPRFYHSGETGDLSCALDHVLKTWPASPCVLAGVSLGGNVLLKWLGERRSDLPPRVCGAAAVSVPFDLERGARHLERGFARVYNRYFVRSLRSKARVKLARYPGLFDSAALERARSIYEFDDAVTAPVHGFADAHDYYMKSSALGWIDTIRLPTLLLSAQDDPFLPAEVLREVERRAAANRWLSVEFTAHGGHVGFVSAPSRGRARYYAEWRTCEFLASTVD
ncbi:MAG TPA: hydrolase [Gemmatimonadaceae bacterium]|nr:hydrolase [Gemmatimonadaceae bacterium]